MKLKYFRVEAEVVSKEVSEQVSFYLLTDKLSLGYVENLVKIRIEAPLKDVENIDIVVEEAYKNK